jgi:hypothetical protein
MKDYLLDIVKHTAGFNALTLIKVTGTETSTVVDSWDRADKTVVLHAEFKAPVAEFVGKFGMPNIDRLNSILSNPEYAEDAKFTVETQKNATTGLDELSAIHFENKDGDFKNSYRFMAGNIADSQMPTLSMKKQISTWTTEIRPSVTSIQRLRLQTQIHNASTVFSTRVVDGDLVVYFGDPSSHTGNFIFHKDTGWTLKNETYWPTATINSVLSMPGEKTMKLSDENTAMITVDSGLAVYSYRIMAQTK